MLTEIKVNLRKFYWIRMNLKAFNQLYLFFNKIAFIMICDSNRIQKNW